MKTIFSGVQPSGSLHLGNYLGSIERWLQLQQNPDQRCIFGIMDLHSITVPQNPAELKKSIIAVASAYLAAGLDPAKSIIFIQSEVSAHLELAWILSCIAPLGWLNRMTQFKDKASKGGEEQASLGLYSYPALMAADILLYKTDLVPVGDDQKQHLEFARDIASAFNSRFKTEYFKLPQPLIAKTTKRIMSLQDGGRKMSKSDDSELSRINLEDDADTIIKKIKKAKTDSLATITYDESRKEIYNLLNIFGSVTDRDPAEIAKEYESAGNAKFKNDLAEALIEKLAPIQQRLTALDVSEVKRILGEGKERAQGIAAQTKKEVFEIVGLGTSV